MSSGSADMAGHVPTLGDILRKSSVLFRFRRHEATNQKWNGLDLEILFSRPFDLSRRNTKQMNKNFPAAMLALLALSSAAHAAPAKPKPTASAKSVAPIAKPDSTKTGVNITPITRNQSISKTTLQLAENGEAKLPIVISDKASGGTKAVAADLKKYLDQMSGADFQIKTGDGTSGIVLGNIKEFPVPALNKALEIKNNFDGKEAYAIRTRDKKVMILGATDKGVSHAAYRFLEEMGCRWFFPSATGNWEVIPETPDLKFAREITDRPAFLSRSIWYAWSLFSDAGHPIKGRGAGSDYGDWLRHNAMAESLTVRIGHAYEAIAQQNADLLAKHPEYWALIGGKRSGPQFELSNPGARKMIVDYAIRYFKERPEEDMVSVDPADGGGTSESAESAKLGNASDLSFGMANEVAKALQKAYPGQNKMVGMLAYNWHSDPPPFALEPNVYIQLTMGFNGGKLTLDQLFEEWPKKVKNLGFYDYYSTWRWDFDRWPGGRAGNIHYPTDMIRRFQKANAKSGAYATSVSAESSNNWGVNGRGYYLAGKLLWNPQADEKAVMNDFYDKAFGPAAPAMKKYFAIQDDPPPMSPGVIGALFRRLGEAREAAKGDAAIMRRVDDITNYLHYEDLNRRSNPAEVHEFAYRTRYSYMNHWNAILLDSIKDLNANDANFPRLWKVDKAVTPAETEAWFQDGLKAYPDLKIPTQIRFSDKLVPVNLGGDKKAFTSQNFLDQGGGTHFFFYSNGAPLKMKSTSILMYWGDRRTYTVKDSKGAVIATAVPPSAREGKPVPPETSIELNIPLPAPGIYEFVYSDPRDQWRFEIGPETPIAFPVSINVGTTTLDRVMPDLYFYVPKGTKEVNYYFSRAPWANSGPHDVVTPDGKIQKTVTDADNGSYISVPVPAGMDGKPWHFTSPKNSPQGFGLSNFHFFNVPNLLSASTAQMLLPQDIVAKDGLKPIK